jgi:hypothetical protein
MGGYAVGIYIICAPLKLIQKARHAREKARIPDGGMGRLSFVATISNLFSELYS